MLPFETILRTPTRSEVNAPSFRLDWYGDRDIAVYLLTEPPRTAEAVHLFIERVQRMLVEWPPEKPFRVIFSIHAPARTHYARQQVQHVLDDLPDHAAGRVAFVLPDAAPGEVIRLAIRRQHFPDLEVQTFRRMTHAAAWVESYDMRPAES